MISEEILKQRGCPCANFNCECFDDSKKSNCGARGLGGINECIDYEASMSELDEYGG